MAMKYLGKTIDIHGGGLDNKFPHHECEIAQSEAANDVQFVRYWLHNNMVTVDGQKMSRSLNNFINLKQAFSGAHERLTRSYEPMAIRQLVLNSHYRSPLDFSDAALFAAQSGFEKISRAVVDIRRKLSTAPSSQIDEQVKTHLEQLKEKFITAMDDDLNTSIALSVIFELVRLANELIEKVGVSAETLKAVDELLETLAGDVLGLVKESYGQTNEDAYYKLCSTIEILLEQRNGARSRKDFETADAIRDKLSEMGVIIEDKPDQTIWRWK